MMALTMMLIRYCLILPAFHTEALITGVMPEHMSRINFALLTFATLLIAAAGNIINDRFDIIADEINKPGKNIISKAISINAANRAFLTLSIIGSFIGIWLGMLTGKPAIAFIHPFCAVSLWMYAAYYKRRLLSGNLLIALLAMLLVLVPGLFEPEFYRNFIYLLIYGLFAFLSTLSREIIKDIEDLDGDERMQCKTIPVRYGINAAKRIAMTIIVITIIFLSAVIHYFFLDSTVISWWNLMLILTLPLLGLLYLLIQAKEQKDFHWSSQFMKAYMLLGILTMFPLWYYILK